MSIINTGIYYPSSSGSINSGFVTLKIGVSFDFQIKSTTPLSILPSSGTSIYLTGLSSAITGKLITVAGQGSTGEVISSRLIDDTGNTGTFFISNGFGTSNARSGQSSIGPILFSPDEEVIISTTSSSLTNITVTYNEVLSS